MFVCSVILGYRCRNWDQEETREEGKEAQEAWKEVARTWRKRWCQRWSWGMFDFYYLAMHVLIWDLTHTWSCLSVRHAISAWLRTIGWSQTVDLITEVSQTSQPPTGYYTFEASLEYTNLYSLTFPWHVCLFSFFALTCRWRMEKQTPL